MIKTSVLDGGPAYGNDFPWSDLKIFFEESAKCSMAVKIPFTNLGSKL